MRQSAKTKLVYVTGLHAVQFGNNWIEKIPLTAKLDWTVKLGNFDRPHNFFHPFFFFQIGQEVQLRHNPTWLYKSNTRWPMTCCNRTLGVGL